MVHSRNGLWHLEREGDEFLLTREAELAWRSELPLSVEGDGRFYLSDRGWSIVETQGVDWGEVLAVSPEGEICTRVAISDSENRATWPPAHLQHVILSPGSWPWNDGGSKPHFFINHEGCEFFWWFLREDQRLAFGFSPPRKLDWSELKPLKDLMLQQELVWALTQLQTAEGQASATLRTALSVLIHQDYTGALLQLHILRDRLQSEVTRRSLVPPHPALCPAGGLLRLALWKLHGEAGPPLPELSGLSSQEVFAVAGSPDHIGWWRSDDHSEEGEFWDYYQADSKVTRLLWPPDHSGEKIRRQSREEISPYWTDFRADLLVKGWLENHMPPSLYRDYPPAPECEPVHPVLVELEEVQNVEVFGHFHNSIPIPSEKLVTVGPFQTDGPVDRLLRALARPHNEPSPEQFGWSRPRLKVEFSYCSCDDNPSFLVRLRLKSGQLLQLKTESYYSHMLPWRYRLDGGEIVKTYNREVSLAVADLLNDGFLHRHRLLEFGRFLERYHDGRIPFEERLSSYKPKPIPTDPNALDENKKTALMRASHSEERFRELVENGADLEVRGQQGLTGLQMANADEAERWLRHGAKLETRSESGHTALMFAVHNPKKLKLLITHGAQINATDADGDSALDQAVCSQNLESIEMLLAAGATSPRALDHAKRYLAKAELELERHRAFRDFHTPEEQREHQTERDSMLAELKAKYSNIDWERNPHDDALTRARQVLARIEEM